MEQELKPFWNRISRFNRKLGLFLLFIICIPRFILVLNANATGNYSSIGLIMFISALIPFIMLTRYGRRKIGIIKPKGYLWLPLAFIAGLIFSLLLYYLGKSIYGTGYENWYVYIGRSYNIPAGINSYDKMIMFVVVAITGMIFSPVGEEFFFRGIVHASFAQSIGEQKASAVDSLAFALTHISHFGLVFINNQWSFLPLPALIWVASMFLVSVLFFVFKRYARSVWGAVICHAAFNLGMIYCIFYWL